MLEGEKLKSKLLKPNILLSSIAMLCLEYCFYVNKCNTEKQKIVNNLYISQETGDRRQKTEDRSQETEVVKL